MNLLLIEPDALRDGGMATLGGEVVRHVRTVLKKGVGERLRVGLVEGPMGEGEIVGLSDEELELRCTFGEDIPARASIDLIVAMPRPQTLKKVLQTAASMGVDRIILTRARKVEKSYFASPLLKPEALREELLLGLSQAVDTRLPEVLVVDRFVALCDWLAGPDGHPEALRLVAEPGVEMRLSRVGVTRDARRVTLAIGPEGGWVPFELERLSERGFVPFGLGPRILRVETAVVAVLAQLALLREVSQA